jgi:hypothetical protein
VLYKLIKSIHPLIMSSNCIIRKLVWKYSLIDAYPRDLHTVVPVPDLKGGETTSSDESHGSDSSVDSSNSDSSDESEGSDIDNTSSAGESQGGSNAMGFSQKKDQDSFVFKAIVGAMPPDKLLFLLGQAQAPETETESELGQAQATETDIETVSSSPPTVAETPLNEVDHPEPSTITTPSITPRRSVQFALNDDGEIKVAIRVFTKEGDKKELWWTRKEMNKIRNNCLFVVDRFRTLFQDYIDSVNCILCRSSEEKPVSSEDKELQMLVQHYDARGLEQHIVDLSGDLLKEHVRAVLEEASLLREEGVLQKDEGSRLLGEHSLETSWPGRVLAKMLAECDTIKLLKEHDRDALVEEAVLQHAEESEIPELSVKKDLALPPPAHTSCCVIS